MSGEVDEFGEELTPEEAQIMRFQYTHSLELKAMDLGFDMDNLVHVTPAGKHLIQTGIDTIHLAMMQLMEIDLNTPEAVSLQIEARAAKLMIDTVINTLENGRNAALQLADEEMEG